MEVNIEALEQLLAEEFNGNQTAFAQTFGLERTHVNKVFRNKGKGAGALFCGAILKYCKEKNINDEKYIFFTNSRE